MIIIDFCKGTLQYSNNSLLPRIRNFKVENCTSSELCCCLSTSMTLYFVVVSRGNILSCSIYIFSGSEEKQSYLFTHWSRFSQWPKRSQHPLFHKSHSVNFSYTVLLKKKNYYTIQYFQVMQVLVTDCSIHACTKFWWKINALTTCHLSGASWISHITLVSLKKWI